MFTYINGLLENLIAQLGPLGVGIATFVESLLTPIPSEVILLSAGKISTSPTNALAYIIFATIGSYIGTLPFYLLGYYSKNLTYKLIDQYGKYFFLYKKEVEEAEQYFTKYGKSLIFVGRLIPLVRSVISFPAGFTKMNFGVYSIYTIIGSFLWNTLLIGLGFTLKTQIDQVLEILDSFEKIVLGLLVVAAFTYIVVKIKRGHKSI